MNNNKWKSMPVDEFRKLHSQNLVIPESVEDAEAIILRCMPFAKKEGLYGRTIQFMNEYIADHKPTGKSGMTYEEHLRKIDEQLARCIEFPGYENAKKFVEQ